LNISKEMEYRLASYGLNPNKANNWFQVETLIANVSHATGVCRCGRTYSLTAAIIPSDKGERPVWIAQCEACKSIIGASRELPMR
jgi:hypothetical protein